MDEFDKLNKLIGLKRYEQPPEGFVEDFVSKFRERQREEMLKQPALTLFWEQVKMYFSEKPEQKWALAAAVILLGVFAGWLVMPNVFHVSNDSSHSNRNVMLWRARNFWASSNPSWVPRPMTVN